MAGNTLVSRYGPWALVTGASSGIGEGFASALARCGMNLVLVARRAQLLEALAETLRAEHGVEVRCVPLDLTRDDAAETLTGVVEKLDVGLVVQNAGSGWIGPFEKRSADDHVRLIKLHCEFPVASTALLLPKLRARRRSAVIVVSSAGAWVPMPYYAVYGATKAFLAMWAEALAAELEGTGVDVVVLAPGDTKTGFQDVAGEQSTRWSRVEDVVDAALAGLGRTTIVVPGIENRLGLLLARLLPRRWVVRIMKRRQRAQTPPERLV